MRGASGWIGGAALALAALVGIPPGFTPSPPRPAAAVTALPGIALGAIGVNAPMAASSWATATCGVPIDLPTLFATVPDDAMVRVWFFERFARDSSTGARRWDALDAVVAAADAAPSHPRLLVTLANQDGNCDSGGWKGPGFYQGTNAAGKAYRSWVREVVSRYSGAPAVAAWELVNEPEPSACAGGYRGSRCWGHTTCPSNAVSVLRRFYDAVGAEVHTLDPGSLVSTGSLSQLQCGWAGGGYDAVAASPGVDVLSFHDYGSPGEAVPAPLAEALASAVAAGKPLVVGEAGVEGRDAGSCRSLSDRADLLTAKVVGQLTAGAAAVLAWVYGGAPPVGCDLYLLPDDPFFARLRTDPAVSAARLGTPDQAGANP